MAGAYKNMQDLLRLACIGSLIRSTCPADLPTIHAPFS